MSDQLSQLQDNLKQWAQAASNKGWLSDNAVHVIDATTTATPGSLFEQANRPLVIGFFGGTGVGKSTLMNRFAGEAVARSSAERPTSREITIYVHESVSISNMPEAFPLQRMRTATHKNKQYESVMWIDMPDFDSVEESNRDLVNHWLPHIDVVVYVVSPDRYRDDNGWRLLLEHGNQHAWLFVINHWDRGDERQKADFQSLLASAGLADPLLFCTDSSQSSNKSLDEFAAFESTVSALADQQLIEQLEARGIVQRVKQIRSACDQLRAQMSTPEKIALLTPEWQTHWSNTSGELSDSVEWKLPVLASHYADNEPGLLTSLYLRLRGKREIQAAPTMAADRFNQVLDDSFFARINASTDSFTQVATHTGISISAFQPLINKLKPEWQSNAEATMEASIQQSIAQPSNKTHRAVHQAIGWLCWLLPLLTVSWVAYRLVNVFRIGAHDPAAYLSSNFAIHSLLLLAMSWLVPAIAYIKLKPSREKAAARGAQQGVRCISDNIKEQVEEQIQQLSVDQKEQLDALDKLLSDSSTSSNNKLPESIQRMLIR